MPKPGAVTPAERMAWTNADLFHAVNPPMPEDPTLRFRGDVGLGPSRRVHLADIARVAAAYAVPEPVPPTPAEIARWDVADDGVEVVHTAVDAAGRILGVVVRGEDGRYRYRVGDVLLGRERGRKGLQSAKVVIVKPLGRSA